MHAQAASISGKTQMALAMNNARQKNEQMRKSHGDKSYAIRDVVMGMLAKAPDKRTITIHPGIASKILAEAAHKMRDLTESPLPHHQARKAQFDEARQGVGQGWAEKNAQTAAQDDETEEADGPANVSHRLKFATMKEREARAAIAAMEQDKMAGSLVERAEMDYVLADFGSTLRGLVEGLPDRLSPTLAAHRGDVGGIHKDLEDAAHDLLTEISDHMKRKMEAVTP